MDRIADRVWQTEEPISTFAWNYYEDMELRPAKDILHALVDVVSKNGIYLLNIGPRADGIIPDDQAQILLDIGAWLEKNDEAIYGTRPWYTYGEGPRKEAEQAGEDSDLAYHELSYTAADVRYTTGGETVYAILMGQPDAGSRLLLSAFDESDLPNGLEVLDVRLLEPGKRVEWNHMTSGLSIELPDELPSSIALVLKIQTRTR
jgi:alpha-L-fucosidase